jgi:hypothetical protein
MHRSIKAQNLGPKRNLYSPSTLEIYHGIHLISMLLFHSSMAAHSFKTLSPFLLSPIRLTKLRSVYLSSNSSRRFSHSTSNFSSDDLPCPSTSTSKSVRLKFLDFLTLHLNLNQGTGLFTFLFPIRNWSLDYISCRLQLVILKI